MSATGRSQAIQCAPEAAAPTDWTDIIRQWRSSGMTQLDYCKANNINRNQFVYQSAKLSARAKASSKLMPVKVTQPDQSIPVQNYFVLHYPCGLKLHIPINANQEAIRVLIDCLGA